MPEFEIWMEGYEATGNSAHASYEGSFEAKSFRAACKMWANEKPDRLKYFDAKDLDYWGCRLFDNEDDARKLCG